MANAAPYKAIIRRLLEQVWEEATENDNLVHKGGTYQRVSSTRERITRVLFKQRVNFIDDGFDPRLLFVVWAFFPEEILYFLFSSKFQYSDTINQSDAQD